MAECNAQDENMKKTSDQIPGNGAKQCFDLKNSADNDITSSGIINNADQSEDTEVSSPVRPAEDAVEKFLAGGQKKFEFEYFENLETGDEEGIDFRSDNTILDATNNDDNDNNADDDNDNQSGLEEDECQVEGIIKDGDVIVEDIADHNAELHEENAGKNRMSNANFLAKSLKKRSIRCLKKMQIMEDVREGCDANPPSSPGHAEEERSGGQGQAPIKTEDLSENGLDGHEKEGDMEEVAVKQEKDDKRSDEENEDKIEEHSSNSSTSETNNKRKLDDEDLPIKRLRADIQENFISRDKIINEFIEMAECNSLDQVQTFSEQILSEIKTLNELAKEKEREWNHLLHMKKIKEELLIRLQRKRHVMLINDTDPNDFSPEANGQQSLLKCNQKSSMLRMTTMDKSKQRTFLQNRQHLDINSSLDFRQKQRPLLDVQSIIADYRQRHPEAVPRRGRRIRTSQSDSKSGILGFSGLGQKSGLDPNSELGQLFNNMNGSRDVSRSSTLDTTYPHDQTSFKDILVQFAKLSQNERTELQMHLQHVVKPPPPYPEVTVHPVTTTSTVAPTNSLLHGILTKTPTKAPTNHNSINNPTTNGSKSSFSPTLARLLTAPERAAHNHITSTPTIMSGHLINPNMSISEILSGSKARNEITITPVGSQYESTTKSELLEEETEETADRLVIDETSESTTPRKDDTGSDAGDDVPQCQGCNQKAAQFVCAGCGNQWYCSRDCQIAAWDEHSEVCSG